MELSVVPNHGANTEDAVETDRLNQLPENTQVRIGLFRNHIELTNILLGLLSF